MVRRHTRLDDKQNDVIILIQHRVGLARAATRKQRRVHLDDLVGHVLEKGDWVHLNLPAIATAVERFELRDGRGFGRRPGELLHPDREPMRVLDEARQALGNFYFEAQYQQSPVPEGGNLVEWEWFQTYDSVPPRDGAGDEIIQS